jgi:ADP-L-glycero-D-manno-heptose 6-epimerase
MDRGRQIIVTGGAGFIGSCVVKHLNDLGYEEIGIVDHLGDSDKWKNLVGKRFRSIIEKHQFFEWLDGRESEIAAFIHLGACSSTVERNASYLLENNYHFSVRLAEYALKNSRRFIYASSAATYGNGSMGFSDAHGQLQSLCPLNMYGYSKHLFDLWLQRQGVLEQVAGLKYFNVFGPNEGHKGRMASAIAQLFPTALQGGTLRLFKSNTPEFRNGDQCRDFIYVKDAVRMTCDFLDNTAGGIYNIGSGEARTWNDLAGAIFTALESPIQIDYIDMPSDLSGNYQNYTRAEMSKANAVLGASAHCMPLEAAVHDYVCNHLLLDQLW